MFDTGEIVESFPKSQNGRKYDWDVLADGEIRLLLKGKAFVTGVEAFRSTVIAHAKKTETAVKTTASWHETPDGESIRALYVQFFPGTRYGEEPPA